MKSTFLLTIIICTFSNFALCQTNDAVPEDSLYFSNFNFTWPPPCPYTIENAKKDIENKTLTIVILGDFTGFQELNEIKKESFQIKYNVDFEYIGCLRNWEIKDEDFSGYNKTILDYLVNNYGTEVLKEYDEIWD